MKRRAFLAGLVAAPIAAQLPAPSLTHLEGAAIIPYMPTVTLALARNASITSVAWFRMNGTEPEIIDPAEVYRGTDA